MITFTRKFVCQKCGDKVTRDNCYGRPFSLAKIVRSQLRRAALNNTCFECMVKSAERKIAKCFECGKSEVEIPIIPSITYSKCIDCYEAAIEKGVLEAMQEGGDEREKKN